MHEYDVPLLNEISSRSSPAIRSTPAVVVPWKLPLNVYVKVAGSLSITPVSVTVPLLNDPSLLIAIDAN